MNETEEKVCLAVLKSDQREARVITSDTLINEKFMDSTQNSFILAVYMNNSLLETRVESQGDEDSAHQ